MVTPNFCKLKFFYKEGRGVLLLPFFLLVVSCAANLSNYGRVTIHNGASNDSFTFSVSDEFIKLNANSPKDKENPKMTKAESELLTNLLKQKEHCLNNGGVPIFNITSRQEKIYDMTFAHLIEKNYNAKPVAPSMYFGRCKKE